MFALTVRLAGIFRAIPGIGRYLKDPRNYRTVVTSQGVNGRVYSLTRAPDPIKRFITGVIMFAGITNLADFFIPDSLLGTFNLDDIGGFFGDDTQHPARVVKEWSTPTANFVLLEDGRGGAQKKDGTWTYYRYPKSTPIYASGARNLRDMLKADKALERQMRKVKKAVDRRFPKPGRKAPQVQVIKESGAGELIVAK